MGTEIEIHIFPSDPLYETIDIASNAIAVLKNPQLFFGMENDPLDVQRIEVIEYLEDLMEEMSH